MSHDSHEQSTRFCSLRETRFPVALKCCPSREPVAENAQQDPHDPWTEERGREGGREGGRGEGGREGEEGGRGGRGREGEREGQVRVCCEK